MNATPAAILGPLSGLQELQRQLLGSVPEADIHRCFRPGLGSLGWYLGRSVFREGLWLDEVVRGDQGITGPLRHLFAPGPLPLAERCAALPPRAHLLAWAEQIQDEHLRRLANPGALPDHPLLVEHRLQWFLLQEAAKDYERMLAVLHQRRLSQHLTGFRVTDPLTPRPPSLDLMKVHQGHYRVGSRQEPAAYDNELPPQAVQLSSFRIARRPVSQAEFLGFLIAGGYQDRSLWTEAGWQWRERDGIGHPGPWRRDDRGNWYGIGLNGPLMLLPEQPVLGLSHHEALAFAAWVSAQGGASAGAVLQHEYQWEVAARAGELEGMGQVWEWCANPFHPYPGFSPFPDASTSEIHFGEAQPSLRGGCLHTQPVLRRLSLRHWAPAEDRTGFAGLRLVFPPAD